MYEIHDSWKNRNIAEKFIKETFIRQIGETMKFKVLESKGSEGAGFALCQIFGVETEAAGICACCTCQSGGQC